MLTLLVLEHQFIVSRVEASSIPLQSSSSMIDIHLDGSLSSAVCVPVLFFRAVIMYVSVVVVVMLVVGLRFASEHDVIK